MNAAVLQKVEPTKDDPARGYATFVSPRSNRLVACLFVRDAVSWRALVGKTFEVTALLKDMQEDFG